MKKITTLLTVGVLAIGLTVGAMAQDAGPKGGGKGKVQGQKQPGQKGLGKGQMDQQILAKLNLSADQKAKIEDLNKRTMAQLQALREKGKGGDRQALAQQLRQIQQTRQQELQKILTTEQWNQYQQLVRQQREQIRNKRGEGGKPPAGKTGNGGGG